MRRVLGAPRPIMLGTVVLGVALFGTAPDRAAAADNDLRKKFTKNCGNKGISAVKGDYDPWTEDRRYTWACSSALGDDNPNPAHTETKSKNGWQDKFTKQCGFNQYIYEVSSEHSDEKDDRKWQFKCADYADHGGTLINCGWAEGSSGQSYYTHLTDDFNYQLPEGTILTGVSGKHNQAFSQHDRKFNFKYCYTSCPTGRYQHEAGSGGHTCKDCPHGKFQLQQYNKQDWHSCLDHKACSAGQFFFGSTTTTGFCMPCPKGSYQDEDDHYVFNSCKKCPTGQFSRPDRTACDPPTTVTTTSETTTTVSTTTVTTISSSSSSTTTSTSATTATWSTTTATGTSTTATATSTTESSTTTATATGTSTTATATSTTESSATTATATTTTYIPQACNGDFEAPSCGSLIPMSDCGRNDSHGDFARTFCFVMCGGNCTTTTIQATTITTLPPTSVTTASGESNTATAAVDIGAGPSIRPGPGGDTSSSTGEEGGEEDARSRSKSRSSITWIGVLIAVIVLLLLIGLFFACKHRRDRGNVTLHTARATPLSAFTLAPGSAVDRSAGFVNPRYATEQPVYASTSPQLYESAADTNVMKWSLEHAAMPNLTYSDGHLDSTATYQNPTYGQAQSMLRESSRPEHTAMPNLTYSDGSRNSSTAYQDPTYGQTQNVLLESSRPSPPHSPAAAGPRLLEHHSRSNSLYDDVPIAASPLRALSDPSEMLQQGAVRRGSSTSSMV